MLRRNAFVLPRNPASVGLARRMVRDHLAEWGHTFDEPMLQDAVLVVSEPATDVVRRGAAAPGFPGLDKARPEREFEVAVTALADGSCLVEVSDEAGPPRLRLVGAGEDADRGPRLVESVAAAWGVGSGGRYGKTVWAVVRSAP
ncbi:ATP-binding protein [Streptomyces sp. NBC_00289]|uniref:ATP-binding protein n=1 Tax=Streptomyces sp. NBC_00289 TaxID=2975703 RepID=UPI00325213AF